MSATDYDQDHHSAIPPQRGPSTGREEADTMVKTAVVITGASRGFGRCLALDFCREIAPGSDVDLHLWARHEVDLRETERLARAAWSEKAPGGALRTFVQPVDLGSHSDFAPKIDALLVQLKEVAYDRVYLVHNAGSLGDLCYSQEYDSHDMLVNYFAFNVTSLIWIDKRFLNVFGASREGIASGPSDAASKPVLTLLNITSLCAIEPFATHGLYCTGKAAREMHLRVVAKEQPEAKVRVLSYSPGPMDTDMQRAIRESPRVAADLAEMYGKMHEEGKLIPPHVSSKLGVQLVLRDKFENAAHVDYYDIAPAN